MTSFTYNVYDPLSGAYIAQLDVKAPKWVEAVNTSGTFTGSVVMPEDQSAIDLIRAATTPGMMLYVRTDKGIIPWSGYMTTTRWNSVSNTLSFAAVEWRAYLYRLLVGPKTDLSADNVYTYTQIDQLAIARDLVNKVVAGGFGAGVPVILTETLTSPILRDLLVNGTSFRTLGTWIDSMANRDQGFEWDIYARTSNGVPALYFRTFYPQQGGVVEGLEFFYGEDGNILFYEDPEETNDQRVTRQWAVGTGTADEALPYALDDDPDLGLNEVLRLDNSTTYQDVTNIPTLASHARAEREFYSQTLTLFTFTTTLDQPDAYSYAHGDRCRLVVRDRWLDIDIDSARILQREVAPEDGGGTIKVTVDLSDLTLPDTDTGV